MTDINFIDEFNKYKIYNITCEEYYNLQYNFLCKNYIYEELYFMHESSTIDDLIDDIVYFIVNGQCLLDGYNKHVVKYIRDTYNTLKKTSGFIINDKKFIIEKIIIPKYYNELQLKQQKESCINIEKKIKKKKSIPLILKRKVWDKYVGECIGKTLCLCCNLTPIVQASFSCGHIISEFNGGKLELDNLRPICVSCNSSIGTNNMDEFIKKYAN